MSLPVAKYSWVSDDIEVSPPSKFNPYHDRRGRFASGGAGAASAETFPAAGTLDEQDDHLQRMAVDAFGAMTTEQADAVQQYSEDDFLINAALRKGKLDSEMQSTVKQIEGAINTMHVPADITVYRGAKLSPAASRKLQATAETGGTMTDRGFVSTSLSEQKAREFAGADGVLMRVHVPTGSPGLYLQGYSEESKSDEYELLLQHGSKFSVDGFHGRSAFAEDYGTSQTTVDLTLLPGKGEGA